MMFYFIIPTDKDCYTLFHYDEQNGLKIQLLFNQERKHLQELEQFFSYRGYQKIDASGYDGILSQRSSGVHLPSALENYKTLTMFKRGE